MNLKVLQVAPSLEIGGAEQVGVFLAGEFAAAGRVALCAVHNGPLAGQMQGVSFHILNKNLSLWRRALAALPGARRAWRRLRPPGGGGHEKETSAVLPLSWPYAAAPEIARRFADLLHDSHYDVVHLHSLECAALIAVARRQAGAVVFSQHNILSQRHWREDIEYLRQQLKLVDTVVCPSQASRRDFLAQTGFPPARTRVIPNPSLLAGRPHTARPEIRRLGTISNLGTAKGIDVLLQAWKKLAEEGIHAELEIAGGNASVIRRWKSFARELGLDPLPIFAGQLRSHEGVEEFYSHLDVVLIPSRSEAFSLVAAEAMSQGIAVIAADIPALREVLDDTALFFPRGNAEGLAEVVARVYDNPQLAQRHAAAGYERWRRCFQTSAIARQYGELYLRLTAQPAPICAELRRHSLFM
jgi:glycosyltransferase involved in cell wall biosynthesis